MIVALAAVPLFSDCQKYDESMDARPALCGLLLNTMADAAKEFLGA